jgi:hypothetical protein
MPPAFNVFEHFLRRGPYAAQADFYEFPVNIEKAASVEKLVAAGLLTPLPVGASRGLGQSHRWCV